MTWPAWVFVGFYVCCAIGCVWWLFTEDHKSRRERAKYAKYEPHPDFVRGLRRHSQMPSTLPTVLQGTHVHIPLRHRERPGDQVLPAGQYIVLMDDIQVLAYIDGDSGLEWGEQNNDGTTHLILHLIDEDKPQNVRSDDLLDLTTAALRSFPFAELAGWPVATLARDWSKTKN